MNKLIKIIEKELESLLNKRLNNSVDDDGIHISWVQPH